MIIYIIILLSGVHYIWCALYLVCWNLLEIWSTPWVGAAEII